jgi:hypothetical protein
MKHKLIIGVALFGAFAIGGGIGAAGGATTPKPVISVKTVQAPPITVTNTVTAPPKVITKLKVITKTKTVVHTVTAPPTTVTTSDTPPAPSGGYDPGSFEVQAGLASALNRAVQKQVDSSIQVDATGDCNNNVNGSLTCNVTDQGSDDAQYSVTINGTSYNATLDQSNSIGDNIGSFPSSVSGTFQPSTS